MHRDERQVHGAAPGHPRGGLDLIFPHHENEIAQTRKALEKDLAKYWVHNGFVQINQEKMSKSLGNFFTIRDILTKFLPETLRFFLITQHYRSPLDFSFEAMEEAEKGLAQDLFGKGGDGGGPCPGEMDADRSAEGVCRRDVGH
jgi:hypothetical protein